MLALVRVLLPTPAPTLKKAQKMSAPNRGFRLPSPSPLFLVSFFSGGEERQISLCMLLNELGRKLYKILSRYFDFIDYATGQCAYAKHTQCPGANTQRLVLFATAETRQFAFSGWCAQELISLFSCKVVHGSETPLATAVGCSITCCP